MNRFACFTLIAGLTFQVAAQTPSDAGMAAVQDLGRLNGQALACGELALSGQTKSLMIKHAPKTRGYGEIFETATSTAFLARGREGGCPGAADFTTRLTELSDRLQTVLPTVQ